MKLASTMSSPSSDNKPLVSVRAILILFVTLAIVALVAHKTTRNAATNTITQKMVRVQTASLNNNLMEGQQEARFRKCLDKLNAHREQVAQKFTTSMGSTVDETSFPISADAKYHFVDGQGEKHQVKLSQVSLNRFGILTGLANQAHKITRRPNGELGLLYANNVAVTIDATPSTCHVTNVYDSTTREEVHPDIVSLKNDNIKVVDDDVWPCGTFAIKGVKSGGYLRYDPNIFGLILGRQEIEAAPSVGTQEKWEFILRKDTGAQGALNINTSGAAAPTTYATYFSIQHASQTYKDLAMAEISPDQWNVEALVPGGLRNIVGNYQQKEAGLAWQLFHAKEQSDGVWVRVPHLQILVGLQNIDLVLVNDLSGKCLCINSKLQEANAVTGCSCTSGNALIRMSFLA